MTTLKFRIDPKERKELANTIAEYFKGTAKYTMPGFRYVIEGKAEVLKNSTVVLDDSVTDTDLAFLKDYIGTCGFYPEEEKPEEEKEVMSFSVPDDLTDESYARLQELVASKQTLLRHAFNSEEITVSRKDGTVIFERFPALDGDHTRAYMHFISLLIELAKNGKRVVAKDHEVANEKYAFRCFLLRLGMIGDEYKKTRKILLENLSGSSAFKSGARKEAVADENAEQVNA